jgi:hypothetical protein
MITAVIETYWAFRPWLHLSDGDPHAYWFEPPGSQDAGEPLPYNQNLSMAKALSELALAADSNLYRASPDASQRVSPDAGLTQLQLATEEIPLVVQKTIAWRVADLDPKVLSDGTPCYGWHYKSSDDPDEDEDVKHAQFELGNMAVVLECQLRLNELLERAGHPERVPLTPSIFERLANTFLRIVWHNNQLNGKVDGTGDEGEPGDEGYTKECAGWVPLAQFDPWVWTRARDTTFNPSLPGLRVDNHGALLRYRKFNAMKYLSDFAGQNWLITPAALAVGERPAQSIRTRSGC